MSQHPVFEHPPWIYVFIDDETETTPGYLRIREGDGRPGACVLAVCGSEIALVNVYRRALRRTVWEMPRGYAEMGETSAHAAQRELLEETGIKVEIAQLVSLGTVAPNSGILESEVDLYFAELEPGTTIDPEDVGEVIRADWWPTGTVFEMVRDGAIVDAFTIVALTRALLRGMVHDPSPPHQ